MPFHIKAAPISIAGSSTMSALLSEMGKAYEQETSGIRIDVQSGGSSRGVMDVRAGTAALGMVSRELKAEEGDLHNVLIARDGIGMIVNADNPVTGLSKKQVIDIYTDRITNWKDVGGDDLAITVVSKAEGRSTLEVFSDYFGISYRQIRPDVIIGDNQQGIQTVGSSVAAIGYVSIGSAEYEAEQGAAIRLIALDDQFPSTESVASGDYQISRELNLVYKEPITEQIRDFLTFTRSSKAAELVSRMYFIPVTP
ncbi:phosphate ABC transporter substrate-binding protein (PhoT family) [Marinobacter sp. LV10R520-4]|uniref:phosphate ABC transporter substrate-binding protein n=1 Tax=Marinobacter sp. LV10R520-4 TaxID=1761796 RepID=UPI000BF5AF8E|nr:phosphate ABC transporter substrate-binding protein [Marinobacter sp. LV10R520-4]PFG52392.1 phosphate ABC transporter substrate-binding protein (PhoT family) [Marinobacter sp. LV10R520-4]